MGGSKIRGYVRAKNPQPCILGGMQLGATKKCSACWRGPRPGGSEGKGSKAAGIPSCHSPPRLPAYGGGDFLCQSYRSTQKPSDRVAFRTLRCLSSLQANKSKIWATVILHLQKCITDIQMLPRYNEPVGWPRRGKPSWLRQAEPNKHRSHLHAFLWAIDAVAHHRCGIKSNLRHPEDQLT